MQAIMDFIYKWVAQMGSKVLSLLPQSPFRTFINSFDAPEALSWLNWFVPVGQIMSILALWLTAISLFYLYSVILRWVKIVGD